MFTRGYVCRYCQAKELRRATSKIEAPWQQRAPYISLAKAPPQPTPASDDGYNINPSPTEDSRNHKRNYDLNRPPQSQPRISRDARNSRQQQPGRYSGAAVSLPFETSYTQNRRGTQDVQKHHQPAGVAIQLDALLASPDTLRQAWSYFIKNYPSSDCQALLNPAYQDLRHLQHGEVFKKLLRAVATEWAANPNSLLPRPTSVIQRLKEVGIWRVDFWDHAGWPIARQLFVLEHKQLEGQETVARELADGLLDFWMTLFARHVRHVEHIKETNGALSIDWLALCQMIAGAERKIYDFEVRFFGFFQGLALAPEARKSLLSLALVSIDLLSMDTVTASLPDTRRSDCTGLLKTLLLVSKGSSVGRPAENLRYSLGNFDGAISPVTIDDYVHHMHQLPERIPAMLVALHERSKSTAEEGQEPEDDADQLTPEERAQRLFSKQIQRAQTQQNSPRLQQLWQNVQTAYSKGESGQLKEGIPALLYDQLISAFFAVRRGDVALGVWKFMVENGTQPTTKTWTAMLDGANKAKDWKAADSIWRRMLDSGIALDEVAWIVRVSTLAHKRKYRDALETLEDLGRRWIEASRAPGTQPQAVQPSMKIVNSLVNYLAKLPSSHTLTRVLEWARSFGLKPHVRTYNALISGAFSKGNPADMQDLLQQMSAQGIEPDDATYGIIMDHHITHSLTDQSLTPEQIQAKAFEALETLERQGVKANNVIYAQLIDRLLKQHDNLPAAEAVVSYMLKQNQEPTEHAYTSLVTHYFSLNPPDLASVNDIVERLQTKFQQVNTYFYDRVLLGYAAADSIQHAWGTLRRMRNEQRTPSFQALLEMVLALERAGEWVLLRELVADVEGRGGVMPALKGIGSDQDVIGGFWKTVTRLRVEGRLPPRAAV